MRSTAPTTTTSPPPLSAVLGVSASMFSDLLSEAGPSTSPGTEEWSPEELQKQDTLVVQMWRLYARTEANLPHAQRMGNPQVGDGGHGAETEGPTRIVNAGAATPTSTLPTRADDADEGGGRGT
jgi:hypothetical protein